MHHGIVSPEALLIDPSDKNFVAIVIELLLVS